MADNQDVVKALISLDPKNDDHWTDDDLPRADVVSKLAGRVVKRSEITDADPKFNREAAAGVEAPKTQVAPVTASEPVPQVQGATPTVAPEDVPPPTSQDKNAATSNELDDRIAVAEAALTEKHLAVQKAKDTLEASQREADAANAVLSELLVKRDAIPGHHQGQQGIMDYIAGQNQLRRERHERAQQLRQIGFTAKDMQVKAPIDAAMARKNTRGTARPVMAATVTR